MTQTTYKDRLKSVPTRIPVKMVGVKKGEPPLRCDVCGETTDIYVIRVECHDATKLDICYVCAENIDDATAYPTHCEKDANPKPLAARYGV